MPQVLQVEISDAAGVRTTRTINVLRSWQDGSGAHLFMFGNGSYGYKNGEPVRKSDEFNVISSPIQHRAAMAWWDRAGAEISKSYYMAKDDREAALQGDFQEHGDDDNAMLDAVLYTRTPQARSDAKPEGPFSWMDLFQKRPDWWGQALSIAFGDFVYQRAESSEQGTPAMDGERKAEAGKGKSDAVKKK